MTQDEREFAASHNVSDEQMEFFDLIYKREMRFKAAIWILATTNTALLALLILMQLWR